MLVTELGKTLASFPSAPVSLEDFVDAVVEAASRQEWHKALVFRAMLARPMVRELEIFSNIQISAGRPDAVFPGDYWPLDEFETCYIGQRHPFVDRADVRGEVQGMFADDGPSIMRLEGPEGIGKSYVTSYIRVIQRTKGGFDLAAVDIGSLGPKKLGCTVEILIKEICRQGEGLESAVYKPERTAQETRQADSLLDKLKTALIERQQGLWVVLDEFDGVLLPPSTAEAIQTMIDWADGPLKGILRLILVGAGEQLDLSNWIPVQIPPLQKSHLEDFFANLVKDQGDTITPGALAMAVGCVEQEFEAAGYNDPGDLCEALRRTLEALAFLPAEQS